MTSPYVLEGFNEAFEAWVRDALPVPPARDIQLIVFDWIFTRYDDPYLGVRREVGFPNLWFGAVPNTSRGGSAVQCAYFIFERDHRVRCDSFATLSEPI